MASENLKAKDIDAGASIQSHFLGISLEPLNEFVESCQDLEKVLDAIIDISGAESKKKAERIKHKLRAFEPNITMIGQVKAGKTLLANALTGHPDLLPSDVNPWTSVVTSLHLNPVLGKDAPVASFKFFDHDEWDHLVGMGGRMGELADRAGADQELQKIRDQVFAMREKTKARLGQKFELLLGQRHNYGYLDEELIQRYVCMGDDFEDDDSSADLQGRFADITKSADLYIEGSQIPMPLCIRDTPGVNDTFMMREQITINALRESNICVVVLSAHQALTSMDMALIRLISNIKTREIIIFVNRIDELADPANQVPEIHNSIIQTLKDNAGPADPEIIFGSAYWATIALTGQVNTVVGDSAEAMFKWAEVALELDGEIPPPERMMWDLSGITALYKAVADRIIEGVGRDKLEQLSKQATNLAMGIHASSDVISMRVEGEVDVRLNKRELSAQLKVIEPKFQELLKKQLGAATSDFAARIDQSSERFMDRALESLMQHLEKNGIDKIWHYSPNGLRLLLRSSYQVFCQRYATTCNEVFIEAAAELEATYRKAFNVSVEGFCVVPPNVPLVPAPVSLGKTIALDMQAGWWKNWWQRRRGFRAYTGEFYELIKAEIDPIVSELKGHQLDKLHEIASTVLHEFVSEQRSILMDVADKADVSLKDLDELFGVTAQKERDQLLGVIFEELSVYTA